MTTEAVSNSFVSGTSSKNFGIGMAGSQMSALVLQSVLLFHCVLPIHFCDCWQTASISQSHRQLGPHSFLTS